MRISDWSSDVCSSDLHDLARRPRETVNLSADYRFPFALSLGGTVSVVGDSYDDAGNVTRLDGYVLAGVRAELPIGERFAFYGRVENLFDERYQTVFGYGTVGRAAYRSEEHTSELQSLMRISYAGFCLKKKQTTNITYK